MRKATDMEIASFFAFHIDNPCIEPTTGENIRYIYLREAQKALAKFTNPYARQFLESKIREYS